MRLTETSMPGWQEDENHSSMAQAKRIDPTLGGKGVHQEKSLYLKASLELIQPDTYTQVAGTGGLEWQ